MKRYIETILDDSPLLPALTFDDPSTAENVCRALVRGGIGVLEVTLRTPRAFDILNALRRAFPDVPLGAGTVTRADQLEALLPIGVDFIVTPGLSGSLADAIERFDICALPGVATPSEAMAAQERGHRTLKLFPAGPIGGLAAVKAFGAVFPDVRFCPTGGIAREQFPSYLDLRCVCAVGGSWLVDPAQVDLQDLDTVEQRARTDLALARRRLELRGGSVGAELPD